MSDLIRSPERYVRELCENLLIDYATVDKHSIGQDWFTVEVEIDNGLMAIMTFTIYKEWSEEFNSDQLYIDMNWILINNDETVFNMQEEIRLGSEPSSFQLLKMDLEDKVALARSPFIVAEKEADLVNDYGERYSAEVKELFASVEGANAWIESHEWEATEVKDPRSKVRPMNDWESKIHNSK